VAALLRFEWTACSGTGGRLPPVYPVDITGICIKAPLTGKQRGSGLHFWLRYLLFQSLNLFFNLLSFSIFLPHSGRTEIVRTLQRQTATRFALISFRYKPDKDSFFDFR